MKKIESLLQQIKDNQKAIAAHGKFDKEILKKINYKFRLDWNYHSNKMEGGTLTQSETRSVMVGNLNVDGKPLRDVLEMNGHDEVVKEILGLSKGELRISERRIKQIHRALIAKANENCKTEEIGEWKSNPNHIINYKGEKIEFSAPADVAEEVHEALNKLNAKLDAHFNGKKNGEHPLLIASNFHLEFINIHPFCDGNGRTTRILLNTILMSCGYPPLIIKAQRREEYFNLLADIQAYGGNADLFHLFLAERLIESQELMLKALAGESIEEEDDLQKEFTLLDQQFEALSEDEEIKVLLKDLNFEKVIEGWYSELMVEMIKKLDKYKKFFKETEYIFSLNGIGKQLSNPNLYVKDLMRHFYDSLNKDTSPKKYNLETNLHVRYNKFKRAGTKELDLDYIITIGFRQTTYSVILDQFDNDKKEKFNRNVKTKLLSESLDSREIEKICNIADLCMIENMKHLLEKVK